MPGGKYDGLPQELRQMLEQADATIAYLQSRNPLSPKESFDLLSARYFLQYYEIAQLQIRVDHLEEVVAKLPGEDPPAPAPAPAG